MLAIDQESSPNSFSPDLERAVPTSLTDKFDLAIELPRKIGIGR